MILSYDKLFGIVSESVRRVLNELDSTTTINQLQNLTSTSDLTKAINKQQPYVKKDNDGSSHYNFQKNQVDGNPNNDIPTLNVQISKDEIADLPKKAQNAMSKVSGNANIQVDVTECYSRWCKMLRG